MHSMSHATDLRPRSDTTVGSVAMLRWPSEEERRAQFEADQVPRLLIVGPDDHAPPAGDALEDWMRDPPDPADLVARLTALAHRAEAIRRKPRLDRDGLLWSNQQWVVIPDTQLCVVELLLAHPNQLVSTETITTTYVRNGSSGHPASIRTMIARLVHRFDEVGLRLCIVRSKGLILEVPA